MHKTCLRTRRIAVGSLTAALFVLSALSMVQCTMVGDRVTGVSVSRYSSDGCIKQCNEQYAALFKLEQKRHVAAMAACQALSGDAKNDCLVAESQLHTANMAQLTSDKVACHDGCHHQGSGNGG
jgi:hypothetical protein